MCARLSAIERYPCDVLVVGSGAAALRAAVAAKETNPHVRVILATKGVVGNCGVSARACSDRMAFHATLRYTEPSIPDNWRYHADDIYRIGGYVSDYDLAVILSKGSAEAIEYLDQLGVPFERREDGRLDQFITDGSDFARACYTGPYTANHMVERLLERINSLDIGVVNHCMVTELLKSGKRVVGAIGVNTDIGKTIPRLFQAKAVVLATGGGGEMFGVNVFPEGMTGDGYALAYRAGAHLVNMEFIQIGLSSTKTKLACSGSIMRAVPRFVTGDGEECLGNYFPPGAPPEEIWNQTFEKGSSWPVSYEKGTKIIDIAVYKEMVQGKRVYLDFSRNPEGFDFTRLKPQWRERYLKEATTTPSEGSRGESPFNRLKEINIASVQWLLERGVDLANGEMIEVAPAIQHFQGGIKIRKRANTSIRGLYAAGECAGGQHGANRPGGNSLLDTQVFGKIAGVHATKASRRVRREPPFPRRNIEVYLERLHHLSEGKEGMPAAQVRGAIQNVMSSSASVMRIEGDLRGGLDELKELKNRGVTADDCGLSYALETENMLTVAEMILRAALMRRESRGPHLVFGQFEDNDTIPNLGAAWQRYIIISKSAHGMQLKAEKPMGPTDSA